MQMRRAVRRGIVAAGTLAAGVLVPVGLAGGGAAAAATSGQAPLTAAEAAALSGGATQRVIVVLRDQVPSAPDTPALAGRRAAAVAGVQAPIRAELAQVHAGAVHPVTFLNAIAATVSPGEAARLRANPAVAEVVADRPIPLAAPSDGAVVAAAQAAGARPAGALVPSSAPPTYPSSRACEPGGAVQLNPEALRNIHAADQSGGGQTAQALGYTGAGVKVGFIADGIDINQPDFIRPDGSHVFVDYQDFSGTGTNSPTSGAEAFGDASSIAAQGEHVYNVGTAAKPCNIRILGVAPGASLVGLDVFGGLNVAFNSVFLEAIDYAVNVDHVNVLNESFGSNPFPDTASLDLTKQADDAAVAAGVTVTVSSGDAGVTGTIGSPATDPNLLSVGASTTYRAYVQTGIGAANLGTGYQDNNISGLSSGGTDQSGGSVDLVAPGDLNWSLCSAKPIYLGCGGADYELFGGTSESAPLTAGAAALVIQAYEVHHGGAAPTPAVVKQIIASTAADIDAPADQQGTGLLDVYQAVRAAASYTGSDAPKGSPLLDGTTQFQTATQPGASTTFTETVTDTGRSGANVALSSRTLGAYSTVDDTTVQLTDAGHNEAVVHFTVPAGQARLDGSIAYQSASGSQGAFAAADNLSLFDPSGALAEYNLPQGDGNYGDAQVADPAPGTWTALIFGSPSSAGGSVGAVHFTARTAAWRSFGTLSQPTLHLAPGGSGSFTLTVATPSTPGDTSGSIVLTDGGASPDFTSTTTVPVLVRSLVPTPAPTSSFTGTLTGGNGRQATTGVTKYYQVDVPAGTADLSASITTASTANTFLAQLVDPSTEQSASTATSNLLGSNATGQLTEVPELGTQLHVLAPTPGRWTLVVDFYNQVSGTATSQPFQVSMTTTPAKASAAGLPDSASTSLPAGTPVTVPVTIHNSGPTPEAYFIDGRLAGSTNYQLPSTSNAQTTVPIPGLQVPGYLVPTHTTSITASATAPASIIFDYSSIFGDPDLISTSAPYSGTASGTFTSAAVTPGEWIITPFQSGPDGAKGVKPVTATTAMSATTAPFDPAVSAPTGDLWADSTNPSGPLAPVVVQPGQSVTIPVTITPQGPSGTVVTGTLYVGDQTGVSSTYAGAAPNPIVPEGSDVAAFPYSYTVK